MPTPKKTKELRKEAQAWLKKNPGEFAMRSCYKCNPAHEYFREDNSPWLMTCVECGHWFWRGIDITEKDKKPNKKTK